MKKSQTILTIITLFLILAGCNNKLRNEYKFNITSDTLVLDKKLSTNYLDFFTISEFRDSIYLCFKPAMSNYIYTYYYDSKHLHFLKEDSIPSLFINYDFGNISSASLISKDSIILFQERKLSLYNFKSKQIDFEFEHSNPHKDKVFLLDRSQPFIWDENNKSLLFFIVNYNGKNLKRSNSDNECIGELDFINKKINVLPIHYPNDYNTDKINLPFLDPYFTMNNEYIVTCYGISPDINIYDRKNKTSRFLKLKHEYFTDIEGIPADSAKHKDFLIDKIVRSFRYLRIIYDPYKKVYYRFYGLSMENLRDNDGLLKTYSDKQIGVNIIDTAFNVIGDIVLTDINMIPNWQPTSQGLLQLTTNKGNLIFSKLVIEKK